jgi:hypothetical protein
MFEVIRDIFNIKNTMGIMLFNGKDDFLGRKVYVLEDVARPQGVKIPSETAIWEGEYWLTITYSGRFKRDMPLIYNDEKTLACTSGDKRFDGVRQHIGNTDADTEACQLLGYTRNNSGVYESTNCFNAYLPFLKDVLKNQIEKRVKLTIINKQS